MMCFWLLKEQKHTETKQQEIPNCISYYICNFALK